MMGLPEIRPDDVELIFEHEKLQVWGSRMVDDEKRYFATVTFLATEPIQAGGGTIGGHDVVELIKALQTFMVGERHFVRRGDEQVLVFHPSCGDAQNCPYTAAFLAYERWSEVEPGDWTVGLDDFGRLTIQEART
jgi:hypothetical protein